ncbi:MAG: selenide, water dikinase SelD [Hydrotalea sp.]|nr:selenide, water dikinase SelD [Hydrotalea sp.]
MSQQDQLRLTQFAHGAGCGCKISPQVLKEILAGSPAQNDVRLLVGFDLQDDAAVYRLDGDRVLISTVDFFTPIVDDPFVYGQVAAANALSDVYAMGGTPLLAIAVLGWPVEKLPPAMAGEVIRGARSICELAGIPLAGGHSIESPEPFFGLHVTGESKEQYIKKNSTAKEGDLLFLTKPLGIGIMTTAAKRGLLREEHKHNLYRQLTQLNSFGGTLGQVEGVHAMTDITGFGLAGHVLEMAQGSGLTAELYYKNLPILDEAREYMKQQIVPDATYRNWNAYSGSIKIEQGVPMMEAFQIMPDPQTNGGLLVAVAPAALNIFHVLCKEHGLNEPAPIGKMIQQQEIGIMLQSQEPLID